MKTANTLRTFLKKLTIKDADELLSLHTYPTMYGDYFKKMFVAGEGPQLFTQRLLWLTKCAYTIRLQAEPSKIIGACMVYSNHQHHPEYFLGGTLLSGYRQKSILLDAFDQLKDLVKYGCGITQLQAIENRTEPKVLPVVRLRKMLPAPQKQVDNYGITAIKSSNKALRV
ncbi:hypothetical protein GCM10023231_35310 [Olivibacter ginsenosidimutans]|uniref:GNAT family N-acetyltransferase n=1 Tax=Olivibacter ginsenosidimutans TaxID=1176537 RepID=A0ABP9C0N5_9SPHI